MADRRGPRGTLQRTWRGRLPARQPEAVEAAGWILLVLHVEGDKSYRTLAAELGLDRHLVRKLCYRAAAQLERGLTAD